jgi:NADPH-dependent 2,4-dienoyl-CoA reductase/sulfur reductase-like enzyme
MAKRDLACEVLVIGAGPAGIAAATTAAECGRDVLLVDNNPFAGGQIWRRRTAETSTAQRWFSRLDQASIQWLRGAQVYSADPDVRTVYTETSTDHYAIHYQKLIVATGARERFLPFPGWTLPGVFGAGGIQALVKDGLDIRGKRIVVAGSGPLLLAVAAYLKRHGADIPLIAEQATLGNLARFGLRLIMQPGKFGQSLRLGRDLLGTRYAPGTFPGAAEGDNQLRSVRLHSGQRGITVDCDFLAVGFHLAPNTELPRLMGCHCSGDGVTVDEFQQTSVEDVYATGEVTGIGGVDVALLEGEIAGFAVAGRPDKARTLFKRRKSDQKFAVVLNRVFAPRSDLKIMPEPDTVVCRCEDVTHDELSPHRTWRAAKLHTRCGMGPCQGRICGPAVRFLYGWESASIRPPLYPVRTSSLMMQAQTDNEDSS